jgi:GT2 family glycosyltransferase
LLEISDELFAEPVRLEIPNAWSGHIPFAFWLAKAATPSVFVELGTHSGNSYSAFCQGFVRNGLPTRAFAIDTWRGDEHAGTYGEAIYQDLHTFNESQFQGFSKLLRTEFDKAREYFADGSIDLLHIDGLHTYEAVKHDFDMWLPTLSRSAVVVFHDTNVRERDFGVWKLWKELKGQYPSFEFVHSEGLGILGVGPEQSALLQRLFQLKENSPFTTILRTMFAARGDIFRRRIQVTDFKRQLDHASHELGRIHALWDQAKQAEAEHMQRVHGLEQTIASLTNDVTHLTNDVTHLTNDVTHLTNDATRLTQSLNETNSALASADGQRAHLQDVLKSKDALLREASQAQERAIRNKAEMAALYEHRLTATRDQMHQVCAELTAVFESSTSWRITSPLRKAVTMWRRLRRSAPPALDPVVSLAATVSPGPAGDDSKRSARAVMMARLQALLASNSTIALPTANHPTISIILVLFNQAELTFACLQSIRECVGDEQIEVIILDNNSTDLTTKLLDRVNGATIIRNKENLHYLRGVNRAVREATGDYILLLNNDAELLPGTISAALANFVGRSDVGAVGGRIVLPDGTLQEAGSIIWNDGTCVGYARGQPIDDPAVMFRRDVDFCSGAFLLTPRWLFEYLGQFDVKYAPAYYEEVDYCVRLWRAGYRVVYDPNAIILHYEFGSSANADASIAMQQRNLATFQARHAVWLSSRLSNDPANLALAKTVPSGAKRILMIEDRVPHERFGAGYPRAQELIRELVHAGAQVTLFPTAERVENWPDIRLTVGPSVEVALGYGGECLAAFLNARADEFDAIIICRPHNMRIFKEAVRRNPDITKRARVIYDAEAVFAQREILRCKILGEPMTPAEAQALIAEEIDLAQDVDVVTSVSSQELELFRDMGVKSVERLGFAANLELTKADFKDRTKILFVGSVQDEGSPNVDSLHWFVEYVLPRIRSRLGWPIKLTVAGVLGAPSLKPLEGISCDFLGTIEDLKPLFEQARVFVAPTRFSAGIPLKVYTSAALGVPVVATDLIVQQTNWRPGHELMAGADADAFADGCVRLYKEQTLWETVRSGGAARCEVECSRASFQNAVQELLRPVKSGRPAAGMPAMVYTDEEGDYRSWITEFDTLTYGDRKAIACHISGFSAKPLISVIMPTYNTPLSVLRSCIESVQAQLYPHWELCIVDDASPLPHVAEICRDFANRDSRIRFIQREQNGHIAEASNTALAMAKGEFVALLDHDDVMAPHALYMVVHVLNENPECDLVFSDEDKIDEDGRRFDPWFKSDWNYDLMLSQNAVVHLAVYRRSILEEINGFRPEFNGSQDYDLVLRFAERTSPDRIRHIPAILYHWRAIPGSIALDAEEKIYPYEAAARAIGEHLSRLGTGAKVEKQAQLGYYRVRWPLPANPPSVSIIIPTKDKVDLLKVALSSILEKTTYPNYEIVIVDNRSELPETKAYFDLIARTPKVRVITYNKPYNFSALNNWAVGKTTSPVIAFLNNDVEVITSDWLSEMVAHALRPEVGTVGAKLIYPDNTLQHAGVVVGIGKLAGHPHLRQPRATLGYFGRAACTQRFSAVTGACLIMRRSVFLDLGGFDEENFGIAFNDVDLGLKAYKAGLANVWTPHAELFHHESVTVGDAGSPARKARFAQESENFRRIWADPVANDPFYNPNLSIRGGDFRPAFPPRTVKPWSLGW